MPLTFAETPLYYKDDQGQYHRIMTGADMTGYRTAAEQDAIDAAQDAEIDTRAKAEEIAIVITGARPSMVVTAGQYVIVRSSTISGITDGLYTANSALSPSTDVTAANLTAVSNGGFNKLSADIKSATNVIKGTVTPIASINTNAGSYYLKRIGDIVYYMFRFTLVNTTPSSNFELCSLPQGFYPSNRVICVADRLWNRQTSDMPETLACTINVDGLVSANTTGVPGTSTEYILQGCFPI